MTEKKTFHILKGNLQTVSTKKGHYLGNDKRSGCIPFLFLYLTKIQVIYEIVKIEFVMYLY